MRYCRALASIAIALTLLLTPFQPARAQQVNLDAAKKEVMEGVPPGDARDKLARALELSLKMNPLTPDHHFYID